MNINKAYDLISAKLLSWLRDIIKLLPNILLSVLILIVGYFIAKWAKILAMKLLKKVSHNPSLNNLMSSVVFLLVFIITLLTALRILQLDKAVTTFLAGAGIAGLALAFAFQDIAANFLSGIFISFRRPIHIGDIVELKSYMGKVEEINLRDTVLRTFQGEMVIIPNKDVFQNPIKNFSLLGKRRIDLEIGVSYGEDLEKVREVTYNALKNLKGLADNEEITMFDREFGGSTINFILRLWVNTPEQKEYLHVGSEAIIALKKAYDANDIMLPFPTTTLDFGAKGGTLLSEMPVKILATDHN